MKRFFYILIFSLPFTTSYSQSKAIELSHYLFPEFTKGVILMKSGIKREVLLNYNSLTEEMIFKDNGKVLAIGKEEIGQVDTVYIKERKFVVLNNKFVELLYQSGSYLYAEHKCSVIPPGKPAPYGGTTETSAIDTYSSLNAGGVLYDLKLPDGYRTKPFIFYWLKRNGQLVRFLNMKQLARLYNDKKDQFKAYVKNYNVKYENQESIVQLIKYLD
ncbi:MAG: hypothetical protein ABFC28_06500 [Rikenellaceae bacterium]